LFEHDAKLIANNCTSEQIVNSKREISSITLITNNYIFIIGLLECVYNRKCNRLIFFLENFSSKFQFLSPFFAFNIYILIAIVKYVSVYLNDKFNDYVAT